jgi:acetoacetate decarboxylase
MERTPSVEVGYSMPSVAPLYGQPPFVYRDSWLLNILCTTTPDVLKALVPAPLEPNPDNLLLIAINRLNASGFGAYNEAIVAVPTRYGQTGGQYLVVLYVDQDGAIAAGREIWGFPKKGAQITWHEEQAVLSATVQRGGIELIRASMELVAVGQVQDLQQNPWLRLDTWFNVKLIPSVKHHASPEVHQLTSTTLQGLTFKQIYRGRATLTLGGSPVDPLQNLVIQAVQEGVYVQADATLTYGDVLHNYLQAPEQTPP